MKVSNYYFDDLINIPDSVEIRIKQYLYHTVLLHNQFVYLQDTSTKRFHQKGLDTALGHDIDTLLPDFFIKNIHPSDLDMYFKASKAYRKYLCEKEDSIKPFVDSFEMNYRIRSKEGTYIPVLRHITPFIVNEENKVEVFLSICTDISFIGQNNRVKFKVYSDNNPELFDDYLDAKDSMLFSSREMDVLNLLVQGRSSSNIADALFVSINTVNTHRKNLMKKANVNKTIDLVSFAIDNGYVD